MFYPGTPISSINKTDRHDITEILLKVALSIKPYPQPYINFDEIYFSAFYDITEILLKVVLNTINQTYMT